MRKTSRTYKVKKPQLNTNPKINKTRLLNINSWCQKPTNPNTWKTWRMREPTKSNNSLLNQKLMNSINNWTLLIRLVCASVCLTQQFCCKSILWQNRPLHFLWQNRPLYNFGAAGHGGGDTHASHRSRLSVRLSLSYFKLPWGERNKDVIKWVGSVGSGIGRVEWCFSGVSIVLG